MATHGETVTDCVDGAGRFVQFTNPLLGTGQPANRISYTRSPTLSRFFHFATVFGLTPYLSARALCSLDYAISLDGLPLLSWRSREEGEWQCHHPARNPLPSAAPARSVRGEGPLDLRVECAPSRYIGNDGELKVDAATNFTRSSITLHSSQGIWLSLQRAKSVTYVSGMKCDLCPKNGPKKIGSSSWTRTSDHSINSRMLYQLSYRGMLAAL